MAAAAEMAVVSSNDELFINDDDDDDDAPAFEVIFLLFSMCFLSICLMIILLST